MDKKQNIQKDLFEKTVLPKYNLEVKLQLLIDAHAIYDGPVTGKHYEWQKAGSVVLVDSNDATILLEKHIKTQSCCSQSDVYVFQIVD